jgi:hypothetical protein
VRNDQNNADSEKGKYLTNYAKILFPHLLSSSGLSGTGGENGNR